MTTTKKDLSDKKGDNYPTEEINEIKNKSLDKNENKINREDSNSEKNGFLTFGFNQSILSALEKKVIRNLPLFRKKLFLS